MLRGVLAGDSGPARDIVLLNSAGALYAANVAASLAEGIALARLAIDSGGAQAKLEHFIALSQQLGRA